jgi:hypothetical protein
MREVGLVLIQRSSCLLKLQADEVLTVAPRRERQCEWNAANSKHLRVEGQ